MDDTRRRTIDGARSEATSIRVRLERFVREHGIMGNRILSPEEDRKLEAALAVLDRLGTRPIK